MRLYFKLQGLGVVMAEARSTALSANEKYSTELLRKGVGISKTAATAASFLALWLSGSSLLRHLAGYYPAACWHGATTVGKTAGTIMYLILVTCCELLLSAVVCPAFVVKGLTKVVSCQPTS